MAARDEIDLPTEDTQAGLSALVVDDQRVLAQLLAERLALDGFRTTIAGTAADALHLCADRRHDLAFIDLTLPDGNGAMVAAEVKKSSPGAVVVLMTGLAYSMDDPLADRGLFDALLPKPWRPAELGAILSSVRRNKQ